MGEPSPRLSAMTMRFITAVLTSPAMYLDSTTFPRLMGEAQMNLFHPLALS